MLTTRAQLGCSLMSSSRPAVVAASSWRCGGALLALPLLIPQNHSKHWYSRPGARDPGSGDVEATVS